ncbi:MAG: hypothetical protein ABJD24_12455 [Acidimicrobiales bacterium]
MRLKKRLLRELLRDRRVAGQDSASPTSGSDGRTPADFKLPTRRSSSECEVQGLPDVNLINDAGAVVAHTGPALAQADRSAPVVLAPDSWAQAILGLVAESNSGMCGDSPAFTELAIRWSGAAGTIAYSGGGRISLECPQPTVPASPAPLFGMSTSAVIPDPSRYLFAATTARIGEVPRYAVLLINMSGSDEIVPLSSTDYPIYRDSVADTSGQYVLTAERSTRWPPRWTRDSLRDGARGSRVSAGRAHELGVDDD